jgi:hypothetical protein
MSAPISRREFLRGLVPSWATRRNFVVGGVGAGVVIAVSVFVSVIPEVGLLGVLKWSALGVGIVSLFWLLGSIKAYLCGAFKKWPPVVQAIVVVLLKAVGGVAFCAFGAFAYARWESADDKMELYTNIGFMLAFAFFAEWGKRRANQSLEPTPTAVTPAAGQPARQP